MDDIIESVTEAVKEGSGGAAAHEYTAEELEAQTTEFLLAFIDQLTDLSEEGKARLRSNVIERAMNPDQFAEEMTARKPSEITPQDLLKLVAVVMILVILFGFFGYKLYMSIMEKEQKKDKRSKKELKKEKKLNSPPASPRSKKEK